MLDLKDGVRSSRMSVDPAIADTNGQGVLHYSMVLEGGNDALKLAIDNALSITSDGLTIRLEGASSRTSRCATATRARRAAVGR